MKILFSASYRNFVIFNTLFIQITSNEKKQNKTWTFFIQIYYMEKKTAVI